MFGLDVVVSEPYAIGCILVALMLPIVVFKVFAYPKELGVPIMMMAISLILYSWVSVVVLLILCIGRRVYVPSED